MSTFTWIGKVGGNEFNIRNFVLTHRNIIIIDGSWVTLGVLSWVTCNCPVLTFSNYCWWSESRVTQSQPLPSGVRNLTEEARGQWRDQARPQLVSRATFPEIERSLEQSHCHESAGAAEFIVTLLSSSLLHHCHQINSGLENFPPLLPAHSGSDLGLLQLTHHFKSLGFSSLFLTTAYLISLETLKLLIFLWIQKAHHHLVMNWHNVTYLW